MTDQQQYPPESYPYVQPYPFYGVQQLPKPNRGLAIAALVLGIVAVIFGTVPLTFLVALGCGLLALIFGVAGRRHGMGKAGLILGIIALALGVWGAVIVAQVNNDINNYSSCLDNAQTVEQVDQC